MESKRAMRHLSLIGILAMPALLGGCLMNDPVEPTQANNPNPPSNNSAPSISGTPPQIVRVGVNYSFTPTASDSDADPLTFSIASQPAWASFDVNTGRLSGVPFLGSEGTYADISISVSDGAMTSALPMFAITVEPTTTANMPPEISGTPAPAVVAGSAYSFIPTATDPDGDPMTFSVLNQPSWATFDINTGELAGTPQTADVGSFAGISITVSDGQLNSSTPAFTILVTASNSAPTISGTPSASAIAGQLWSFTPTASDPDADTLTFLIVNRPAWASFDSGTGSLSGVPQAADAGTFSDIRISVSDGNQTAMLTPFSIDVTQVALGSVTLSWTPPTVNTDGSSLNDLAGYRIYYGTSQGSYPNTVVVNNPGLSSYVVDNLAPGTYFFVTTAVNTQGMESDYSNVAQKVVN